MSAPIELSEWDAEREAIVFAPHYPPTLKVMTHYRTPCDDKGREGMTWFGVMVSRDGDVHVSAQEREHLDDEPSPFPSIRVRTGMGGGRNWRTRQALLWLARAMQLDAEEQRRPLPGSATSTEGDDNG